MTQILTKEDIDNFIDMKDAILARAEELLPIFYASQGKRIDKPLDYYYIRTIGNAGVTFECSWGECDTVSSLWFPTQLLWDAKLLEEVEEKANRREEEKRQKQKEKERQKQEVQEAKERETLAALLTKYGVPEK